MDCSGTKPGCLCGFVDIYHISRHLVFGFVSAYKCIIQLCKYIRIVERLCDSNTHGWQFMFILRLVK